MLFLFPIYKLFPKISLKNNRVQIIQFTNHFVKPTVYASTLGIETWLTDDDGDDDEDDDDGGDDEQLLRIKSKMLFDQFHTNRF